MHWVPRSSPYDLVSRSVIQRLNDLKVPEQYIMPRLVLHAMGPIRSDGHHKLYFSDLHITPTLSTLIEDR